MTRSVPEMFNESCIDLCRNNTFLPIESDEKLKFMIVAALVIYFHQMNEFD